MKQQTSLKRKSLPLTDAEWQALESLAAETDSLAPRGTSIGDPSWRTLIKRIANGELLIISISDPEPST